jgi:hypothetical protein
MNVLRITRSGRSARQASIRLSVPSAFARSLHQLEDARARVLERYVEIGQQSSLRRIRGHSSDDLVDVRIRIHVVQPHPRAVRARHRVERARELDHPCLQWAPLPESGSIPDIDAIRARVLRDDEQLLDAGAEKPLGFGQHLADGTAHEIAAHRRNDAERAPVVAAFADLQVRIVLRRQLDSLRRDEVCERIVELRQVLMHSRHHFGRRMRTGDGEDTRVRVANERSAFLRAEAAGDDDLAVFRERLTDRIERLLDGRVDEAARVDDDEVGSRVARRDRIGLRREAE